MSSPVTFDFSVWDIVPTALTMWNNFSQYTVWLQAIIILTIVVNGVMAIVQRVNETATDDD